MDREVDDDLRFTPMDESQRADLVATSRSAFVEGQIAAGRDRNAVEATADEMQATVLRSDVLAADHWIGHLVVGTNIVGHLWVARDGAGRWYVWDVEINAAHRGRGFGRRAMELAHGMARADGAREIGLSVLATNQVALALYRSLEYVEAEAHADSLRHLHKQL